MRARDSNRVPAHEALHMCYRCDSLTDLILKFLERRLSGAQVYFAERNNSLLFRESFYVLLLTSISEILGKEQRVPLRAYYVSGTTALPTAQRWEQPAFRWKIGN
jgi:hypothetical protein